MSADVLERAIAPERTAKSSFRPDVQGLRAVAVVAVILHHLLGSPGGGFVGVDVFFVISGFLITGLLLREHERTGRISFVGFYRRRIKRILPAAVLVLVVTTAASAVVFVGARSGQIAGDAVWSLFFAANWRFVSVGTDYFTQGAPVSPLQHYWSLAVEEQFYFVWPWLMLLVLVVAARRRMGDTAAARRSVGLALSLITAASFAWALVETAASPASAYFSTFSRTWELGIGALIAVFAGTFERLPARSRPVLAWAGLGAILAGVLLIGEGTGFPAPAAALPVVGAALVIVAGTGGAQRGPWPLTNPVSRWIGDLSYSLYLWHFPAIVLLGALLAGRPALLVPLALAVTLAASVAGYYLVEDPIRRSAWLERRVAARRAVPQRGGRITRPRLLAVAATTALAAVLGTASVAAPAMWGRIVPDRADPSPAGSLADLERGLALDLARAANAEDWPARLRPAPETIGDEFFQTPVEVFGCAEAHPDGRPCGAIGAEDPEHTAVVVGDSVGAAWVPTIREVLETRGWRVVPLTLVGCPFLDEASLDPDPELQQACPRHKAAVVETIQRIRPAVVIAANSAELDFVDPVKGPDEARRDGLRGVAARLSPYVGGWVTLSAPPPGKDPRSCVTRLTGPAACRSTISPEWRRVAAAEAEAMAAEDGVYIRTDPWFCVEGTCPIFVRDTMILRDRIHITTEYATALEPLLAEALWERRDEILR